MSSSSLSRRDLLLSLKFGVIEACFSVPMLQMTLAGMPFMVGFAVKVLGWNSTEVGLICSAPFICNFIQPLLTHMLQKFYSIRRMTLLCLILNAFPWAFVAFFPFMNDHVGIAFATIVVISTLANSVGGVAWSAAMSELVPLNIRGRYFAARNLIFGFWTMLLLLIAGYYVDLKSNSLTVFGFIFTLASASRLVGVFYFSRMKFPKSVTAADQKSPSFAEYREVFQNRDFIRLVLFAGLFSFFLQISGPFYNVFVLEELDFSLGQLTILTSLAGIGSLASSKSWGALSDRFGNKPVMATTAILWMSVSIVAWAFAAPGRYYHLYPNYFVGGFAAGGFILASFNMMLKLVSSKNKTHYISVYVALTSLISAGGPILGSKILNWIPSRLGVFLGEPITNYHALFLISLSLCLLSIHLLQVIREPSERSLSEMIGSMRTMREFNPVLGFSYLAHYMFTPTGWTKLARSSYRTLRRNTHALSEVGEDLVENGFQAIKQPLKIIPFSQDKGDDDQPKKAA